MTRWPQFILADRVERVQHGVFDALHLRQSAPGPRTSSVICSEPSSSARLSKPSTCNWSLLSSVKRRRSDAPEERRNSSLSVSVPRRRLNSGRNLLSATSTTSAITVVATAPR
jgi:hypothetical protein